MARSRWAARAALEHLLAGCTLENRLALEMSMDYGLRIGDVLRLPTEAARRGIWSFKEEKTGKRRRIKLGAERQRQLLSISGKLYVFEHRLDWRKHRTRQAVYKDLVRMAKAFRLAHVTPHSARKTYAVEKYHEGGDLKRVQRLLNHSDEAVTLLYAMADQLTAKNAKQPCDRPDGETKARPKGVDAGRSLQTNVIKL